MYHRYVFGSSVDVIPLSSLVFAISELMDYGYHNPLQFHQMRASFICRAMARVLELKDKDFEDVVIGAAFHDIGLIKTMDKERLLADDEKVVIQHSLVGSQILKAFPYTERLSVYIRCHHFPWSRLRNEYDYDTAVKCNLIYLADYVERISRNLRPLVSNIDVVKEEIFRCKDHFAPEVLDAFLKISEKDLFWYRLENFKKETEVFFDPNYITMIPKSEITGLAKLLALLIDAKSHYTMMHSRGVAILCRWIGSAFYIKGEELRMLEVAGYLHDIGKLTVPESILDKPGRLSGSEWSIMKSHAFFTYRALEQIPHFDPIYRWAAQHHERIDGRGYPAGIDENQLSLPSRIVAVADVTTALLENRPYRRGLSPKEVVGILKDMAGLSLDSALVDFVCDNVDYAYHLVREAEEEREEEFNRIGISVG